MPAGTQLARTRMAKGIEGHVAVAQTAPVFAWGTGMRPDPFNPCGLRTCTPQRGYGTEQPGGGGSGWLNQAEKADRSACGRARGWACVGGGVATRV